MIALKRILVATDFGEAAAAALTYGRELTRIFGGQMQVLHVVDDLAARYPMDMYPGGFAELQLDIETEAGKRLRGLLDDEDVKQLGAVPVIRSSNVPAATIARYAKEARIDLIVMGTHGRGVLSHALLGSVAERVVRSAPCPVLTVRHPEHEFLAPDAMVPVAKS